MSGSALYETFARAPLAFERGEGSWLVTDNGERYLDFAGGIAVNSLGHSHPHLVAALTEQAGKLWHVSNLYEIPGQSRLGERLADATFADKVFFTNSGAEALECAIKTARRYQFVNGHPERFRIITFEGAFHGRTLATIAAGGQDEISRRLRPQGRRLRPGRLRRHRRRRKADHAGDRRDPDRAGAGRGRHPRRADAVAEAAARSSATSTACC